MKWCVYWQPDDIEAVFFRTEAEALNLVAELITATEEASVDGECNVYWDITLLKVVGEMKDSMNGLRLVREDA